MKMISMTAIIVVAAGFATDLAARPRERFQQRENQAEQGNNWRGNNGNFNDDAQPQNNFRNRRNFENENPNNGYPNNGYPNNNGQNAANRYPNTYNNPAYNNQPRAIQPLSATSNYVRPQAVTPIPAVVTQVAPPPPKPLAQIAAPKGDPNGQITLRNPEDSGGTVSFAFDEDVITLHPGQARSVLNLKLRVVAFGSGGSLGEVKYTLSPGIYKFKVTDQGWNLYKSTDQPPPTNEPEPTPART